MDFVRLTQLCKQMKGEATGLCRTSRTSLKVYYNNNKKRQQREAPRAFQEPSELEAAMLRASFSPCKAVLTRRAGKQEQEPVLCVPRPGGPAAHCAGCWQGLWESSLRLGTLCFPPHGTLELGSHTWFGTTSVSFRGPAAAGHPREDPAAAPGRARGRHEQGGRTRRSFSMAGSGRRRRRR